MNAFKKIIGHNEDGTPIRSPYFTYQFMHKSQRVRVHTKHTVKADALQAARADLAARQAGLTAQVIALTKPQQAPGSTLKLQTILDTYTSSPLELKPITKKRNAAVLKLLFKRAGHADPGSTPLSQLLTPSTAAAYWTSWKQAIDTGTPSASASAKKNAISISRQALSLFTRPAIAHYKQTGHTLPEAAIQDFISQMESKRFRRIPKAHIEIPTDEQIKAIIEAWKSLPDESRDIFLAIGHELSFGLRASELAQCRWNLWTLRDNQPYLSGAIQDKAGGNYICIRALDPWYTLMQERINASKWRGDPTDYIIPGSTSYRCDALPRSVSQFMRNLGWTGHKTNHRLRAWSGSQIAMKYGIYDASVWLRHSSVKITQDHYALYVNTTQISNKDTIESHYAVSQAATPVLTIVPQVASS